MNEKTIQQQISSGEKPYYMSEINHVYKKEKMENNLPMSFSNFPMKIFSSVLIYMKWFFSLRWYVILLIVVFVLFIIFQFEHSIESRRIKKESHKEDGPHIENMRGIIKESYTENAHQSRKNGLKKTVSFKDTNEYQEFTNYREDYGGISVDPRSNDVFIKIYNLWILPVIYLLYRKIGFV